MLALLDHHPLDLAADLGRDGRLAPRHHVAGGVQQRAALRRAAPGRLGGGRLDGRQVGAGDQEPDAGADDERRDQSRARRSAASARRPRHGVAGGAAARRRARSSADRQGLPNSCRVPKARTRARRRASASANPCSPLSEAKEPRGISLARQVNSTQSLGDARGFGEARGVSDQLDQRRRTHDRLAARLAALGDDELAALLAETDFVAHQWPRQPVRGDRGRGRKGLRQEDRAHRSRAERRERGSTANLFGLPLFYHYGVGSAGFGAWRELSAYLKAGAWALSGECPHFPLVYHWRVTPRAARPPLTAEQQARLEGVVGYWDHSDAVRARLEAIVAATASIVLFLEHVPQTLHEWLGVQVERPDPARRRLGGGDPSACTTSGAAPRPS